MESTPGEEEVSLRSLKDKLKKEILRELLDELKAVK
jgi:hypothetical protein